MAVEYKVIRTAQPGVKGGGSYKYYPRVHRRKKIGLRELAKNISQKCTLNEIDIHATLMALVEEIPDLLKDNYSIELGELGIFSLHINGIPSDSPEEVTKTKIKSVKVAFRPGKAIKKGLRTVLFTAKK